MKSNDLWKDKNICQKEEGLENRYDEIEHPVHYY